MNPEVLERRVLDAVQKLGKWRTWFASWQTGTRSDTDAECAAIKDHRELSIMLRAEVNALTKVLIDKGVMTPVEFNEAVLHEAEQLDKDYERRFPGVRATLDGLTLSLPAARDTMQRMNFRP